MQKKDILEQIRDIMTENNCSPQRLKTIAELICKQDLAVRYLSIACSQPTQTITIKTLDGGGFGLERRYGKSGWESYAPTKTRKGLLNAVENILNGYQPDPYDIHRQTDGNPRIHCKVYKRPKPLD